MLMPKRVKHRNQHRGRMTGVASRGQFVEFGDQGLMAIESAWITDRQIESARVALTRFTKKGGRVWIRIFPDHPSTKKPAETRMGKGKGAPDHWVAVIKPGRVMFEIGGIPQESAKKALSMASHKLPIKTKIVERDRTIKVI